MLLLTAVTTTICHRLPNNVASGIGEKEDKRKEKVFY